MRPPPLIFVLYATVRERLPRGPVLVDLASSYALSLSRVSAAAVVVGTLYRHAGPASAALFLSTRAMLSVLTYAFAGVNPAVQTGLHRAMTRVDDALPLNEAPAARGGLEYEGRPPRPSQAESAYGSERQVVVSARWAVFAITILVVPYIVLATSTVGVSYYADPSVPQAATFALAFSIGTWLRLVSEVSGGVSQARGLLRYDNVVQVVGEIGWATAIGRHFDRSSADTGIVAVGLAYMVSGLCIAVGRWLIASRALFLSVGPTGANLVVIRAILIAALTISLGSIADFLYGPSNVLIINRLLSPTLVADYGPALQVDGALLLSVSAIAVVLLPAVVRRMHIGEIGHVRRLYVSASLASAGILALLAVLVVALRDLLLRKWLGTVPDVARMILPWVLVHTVIGGTAGVGRAVLLGMGRFKAYTISALIGGLLNVSLALTFVLLGFGLRGIALATIIAVTLRCAIWMPWYILRATRSPTAANA